MAGLDSGSKNAGMTVEGRKGPAINSFRYLREIVWLKARVGLFNPASHGIEQK
jgi:hypothetical protein